MWDWAVKMRKNVDWKSYLEEISLLCHFSANSEKILNQKLKKIEIYLTKIVEKMND